MIAGCFTSRVLGSQSILRNRLSPANHSTRIHGTDHSFMNECKFQNNLAFDGCLRHRNTTSNQGPPIQRSKARRSVEPAKQRWILILDWARMPQWILCRARKWILVRMILFRHARDRRTCKATLQAIQSGFIQSNSECDEWWRPFAERKWFLSSHCTQTRLLQFFDRLILGKNLWFGKFAQILFQNNGFDNIKQPAKLDQPKL